MSKLDYLSPAWLEAADEAAADVILDTSDDVEVITVTVTAADRDIVYRLASVDGHLRILSGPGEPGHGATMTMDHTTAAALSRGERSAQRAFLDGAISLGGDLSLLLDGTTVKALGAANDCFAQLRGRTIYPD